MHQSGRSERIALGSFVAELLIAADSDRGRRLLAEAATVDYAPLAEYFEGQRRKNFCSVATSVIALNALRGQAAHSQSAFFTAEVAAIREEAHVEEDGMTLAELGAVLESHVARVTLHYAEEQGLEAFRAIAVENLNNHGDFLIVNYLRETFGQSSGGHFSPLAAYHPATDRFLVLDVADVRYPPVWVEARLLYRAMATIDEHSGKSRGFIAIAM